jgi:hypothetical protein
MLGFPVFPAGIAAQEGHEACVRALLIHGADPNHSDRCGRNALRVAAKSGHDSVVRLLEEFSASQKQQLGRPGINGGECYIFISEFYVTLHYIPWIQS